jgi:type II secretory pathway pseudopilin PulG
MKRGFKFRNSPTTKSPNPQSGYMLFTLMLIVTLAALALMAVLPDMKQQIRRDQEEEMCHRGTQYMRAIQHFYKKFGRYPTRIEDLENTNNLRFLRKRYKDPLMRDAQGKEKDFKLLHMQDVNLSNGPVMGAAAGQGQGLGLGSGGLGQNAGGLGALGGAAVQGAVQGAMGAIQQQAGGAGAAAQNNGEDESENSPNAPGNSSPGGGPGGPGFNTGSTTGTGLNGTVFGGGPILGVASTDKKDKTIREFNKKNHYTDWMFIYDPTSDRGGLLVGPWQIPNTTTLPGATPAGQLTPGAQQPSGFGQPIGSQSPNPQPQAPQPQAPQNQDAPLQP